MTLYKNKNEMQTILVFCDHKGWHVHKELNTTRCNTMWSCRLSAGPFEGFGIGSTEFECQRIAALKVLYLLKFSFPKMIDHELETHDPMCLIASPLAGESYADMIQRFAGAKGPPNTDGHFRTDDKVDADENTAAFVGAGDNVGGSESATDTNDGAPNSTVLDKRDDCKYDINRMYELCTYHGAGRQVSYREYLAQLGLTYSPNIVTYSRLNPYAREFIPRHLRSTYGYDNRRGRFQTSFNPAVAPPVNSNYFFQPRYVNHTGGLRHNPVYGGHPAYSPPLPIPNYYPVISRGPGPNYCPFRASTRGIKPYTYQNNNNFNCPTTSMPRNRPPYKFNVNPYGNHPNYYANYNQRFRGVGSNDQGSNQTFQHDNSGYQYNRGTPNRRYNRRGGNYGSRSRYNNKNDRNAESNNNDYTTNNEAVNIENEFDQRNNAAKDNNAHGTGSDVENRGQSHNTDDVGLVVAEGKNDKTFLVDDKETVSAYNISFESADSTNQQDVSSKKDEEDTDVEFKKYADQKYVFSKMDEEDSDVKIEKHADQQDVLSKMDEEDSDVEIEKHADQQDVLSKMDEEDSDVEIEKHADQQDVSSKMDKEDADVEIEKHADQQDISSKMDEENSDVEFEKHADQQDISSKMDEEDSDLEFDKYDEDRFIDKDRFID